MFETNSSSTHSLVINGEPGVFTDTLWSRDGQTVVVEGGEYGWEYNTYHCAGGKLDYMATLIFGEYEDDKESQEMLCRVVKEQTGYDLIWKPRMRASWSGDGTMVADVYIDHQSVGRIWDGSEEELKNIIFNPGYYIETDNDNH